MYRDCFEGKRRYKNIVISFWQCTLDCVQSVPHLQQQQTTDLHTQILLPSYQISHQYCIHSEIIFDAVFRDFQCCCIMYFELKFRDCTLFVATMLGSGRRTLSSRHGWNFLLSSSQALDPSNFQRSAYWEQSFSGTNVVRA